MSIKTKTLFASILALSYAGIANAGPVLQSDIADCRAAIAEQNPGVLDGYRLRFKSAKGAKTRTINLQAIPNRKTTGDRFNVSCKMSSANSIVAVKMDKDVKLAKK